MGEEIRRFDIEWRGNEIEAFERISKKAEMEDMNVATFIKKLLSRITGD